MSDEEVAQVERERDALLAILLDLLGRAEAKLPPRAERSSNMSAYGVRQLILDGLAAAGVGTDHSTDRPAS